MSTPFLKKAQISAGRRFSVGANGITWPQRPRVLGGSHKSLKQPLGHRIIFVGELRCHCTPRIKCLPGIQAASTRPSSAVAAAHRTGDRSFTPWWWQLLTGNLCAPQSHTAGFPLNGHGVLGSVVGAFHPVVQAGMLGGQVLIQGAAGVCVQKLQAAADAQHRLVQPEGGIQQNSLHPVPDGAEGTAGGLLFLPVQGRVHILPPGSSRPSQVRMKYSSSLLSWVRGSITGMDRHSSSAFM